MSEFSQRSRVLAHVTCTLFILIFASAVIQSADAQTKKSTQTRVVIVNLQDFGAVGDGVTDDSGAFQQALDAVSAAGGGTLQVPAGHYFLGGPVAKQFDSNIDLTIAGVPSATAIDVAGNGTGLDLTSEFIVAVGETNDAVSLSGLNSLLISDVSFVGVQEVVSDATVVLRLNNIKEATVRHCEFYGLASMMPGGAILMAELTDLRLEQSAFLGCASDSGITTSIVQNLNWLGVAVTDCKFIDYGNRPDFFSKTPYQSPYSWINIGNGAVPVPTWSRREANIRNVFLDEGAYFGISARPDLAGGPTSPYEVYISRIKVNVTNLGGDGVLIVGAHRVFIDQSHFGWSHHAGFAIQLSRVDEAILDLIDCIDDATRLEIDAQRLAVINSNYTALHSTAPFTRVIQTESTDDDPAQYVSQQYLKAFNAGPDPAGHFYWTDQIVRCESDEDCVSQTRVSLDAFLNAGPAANFSLSGRVIDENGAPIPSVLISITGSQSITATTDSSGNFAFERLATAGSYLLTASKEHYSFQSQTLITPTSDQFTSISGTLSRYTISGRVFANTGQPLSGATVALSGAEEGSVTTDETGDYSFPDLPAGGDYVTSVSRDNYTFSISSRSFPGLSADVYSIFEGAVQHFTIGGRVIDESQQGVPGVRVSLAGTGTATAFTDSTGAYSFPVLAGSNYSVTPQDSHLTFSPANASFNDLDANKVANFSASRNGHSIGGRVFDNGGRVLSGATVTLSGSAEQTATSDVNGDFLFDDLDAGGNYTVAVQRNNYTFPVSNYSFSDLISNHWVAFEGVLKNYVISGTVRREDGSVFAGAVVRLSGGLSSTVVAGAAGNYSFTVPAENNYTVTPAVLNYSFSPASKSFTSISGNQTANFVGELVDFTVSGNILTNDGLPLSDVTISITGSESTQILTNQRNDFVVNLQAEGNYVITPIRTNYTFTPASIPFSNLGANHQLNFVATLNANVPIMLAGANPTRALAFDSVLRTVEPFKLEYNYPWNTDRRTRVMLFAKHFDLPAGEGASNITVTAEDAEHHIYPLTVEWAGKVDGTDWLIGVVVRLNDDMTNVGDVLIRITHSGLTSEPLRIGVGHTGGGPQP